MKQVSINMCFEGIQLSFRTRRARAKRVLRLETSASRLRASWDMRGQAPLISWYRLHGLTSADMRREKPLSPTLRLRTSR